VEGKNFQWAVYDDENLLVCCAQDFGMILNVCNKVLIMTM
jgi:uncharacterized protein YacL (UPF0231 family)